MARFSTLSLVVMAAFAIGCGDQRALSPRTHEVVRQEVRPTDTGVAQLFRFEPGDVVERFGVDGGQFAVHFTRAGRNRVPSAVSPDSGVPVFVETVAAVYEDVERTYHQRLGFRTPLRDTGLADNGGDGRFDVYLLDFAGNGSDGAFRRDDCPSPERCIGFMVQENDFVGFNYPSLGEAVRILGSHEYFHAVQSSYDSNQDAVITEGTAVWATEQYDPASDDFENFVGAYLSRPDRSLDAVGTGPVPAAAYGSALFFRFLSERFEPAIIRSLWEHLENGNGLDSEPANKANPTWLIQLDALLKADYRSSFADAFVEFATWNLFVATAADPTTRYAGGDRYPAVASTTVVAPFQASPLRLFYASTQYFTVAPSGRGVMTAALVDDPAVAGDETRDLVVLLATRKSGRNVEVKRVSPDTTISTAQADELMVAVINTAREGKSGVLSRRPGLCIGSPAEVATCRSAIFAVDAGVEAPPDAGISLATPSEVPLPAAKTGCGCEMSDAGGSLLLLGLALLVGRRKTP